MTRALRGAAAGLLALLSPTAGAAEPAPPASAPTQTVPPLARFDGVWHGEGQAFGQPARATLTIGRTLGATASVLDYELDVGATGTPQFRGHGLYLSAPQGAALRGQWADSNGALHRLSGTRIDGGWRIVWGDAASEIGQSTYIIGDDGALTVRDEVMGRDGVWRAFATMRYTRR